jgi:hypothetical protein
MQKAGNDSMRSSLVKQHFYLLCVLPDLKPFGSVPPINKQELLAVVTESGGPTDVVRVLLMSDDLLQREAVLAGEIELEHADLAVLSLQEDNNKQSLPLFLEPAKEDEPEGSGILIAADRIWRRYFHHAARIARMTHTHFLAAWVGFEVGLRNATAKARAETLELDPGQYLVAPDLADPQIRFDTILAEWIAPSNPLDRLKVLDRTRWDWLAEHERWFSFSDDEVAAYTAKLMILHRWHRISGKGVS